MPPHPAQSLMAGAAYQPAVKRRRCQSRIPGSVSGREETTSHASCMLLADSLAPRRQQVRKMLTLALEHASHEADLVPRADVQNGNHISSEVMADATEEALFRLLGEHCIRRYSAQESCSPRHSRSCPQRP
eukprot:gnl/TRDRNA2_/TRDRNA2_49927_c0_seq2.p1 gnl/TRDRNA2_/TRDRNA2_49927_c0~~gnl/TRDRNA2_/TRDRNA2_49927_c0_seq2.p1  ORF type:complete len:138 (+),score=17.79 gnl/TRDRNA2_/TRDRNA2_49927_c0_seq2:23-415(+)